MTAHELREWVEAEREAVRKGIGNAKRAVYWFIAAIVCSTLLLIYLGTIGTFHDLPPVLSLAAPLEGCMLVAALVFSRARKRRLIDFRTHSNVRRVREGELTDIAQCIRSLTLKMNIVGKKLVLYRQITLHCTPSMMESPSEVAILIPLGFLAVFAKDPATGKAMLAHELAHVAHHDANLWVFIGSYAGAFNSLAYMCLTVDVISLIIQGLVLHGLPEIPLGVILMTLYIQSYHKAVCARRRSEYLADYSAALFAGPNTIYQAILGYVENDEIKNEYDSEFKRETAGFGNMPHPPKAWRLSMIQAYAPLIERKASFVEKSERPERVISSHSNLLVSAVQHPSVQKINLHLMASGDAPISVDEAPRCTLLVRELVAMSLGDLERVERLFKHEYQRSRRRPHEVLDRIIAQWRRDL